MILLGLYVFYFFKLVDTKYTKYFDNGPKTMSFRT